MQYKIKKNVLKDVNELNTIILHQLQVKQKALIKTNGKTGPWSQPVSETVWEQPQQRCWPLTFRCRLRDKSMMPFLRPKPPFLPLSLTVIARLMVIFSYRTFYDRYRYDCVLGLWLQKHSWIRKRTRYGADPEPAPHHGWEEGQRALTERPDYCRRSLSVCVNLRCCGQVLI